MSQTPSILALDIGKVRIGVARAAWPNGIPTALTTIANDTALSANLNRLITSQNAQLVVAGKPKTLSGTDSEQTRYTIKLIEKLEAAIGLKIYLQDESGTSLKAEAELKSNRRPYSREDIDALSAVFILEDFLSDHPNGKGL